MEELLNKLIEKGWKPFGFIVSNVRKGPYDSKYFFFEGCADGVTLRQIVSKESGLWQFCKENKMLIGFSPRTRTKNAHETYGSILGDIEYWGSDYEYRLIESALKNEDELEQFLLDNIKVE